MSSRDDWRRRDRSRDRESHRDRDKGRDRDRERERHPKRERSPRDREPRRDRRSRSRSPRRRDRHERYGSERSKGDHPDRRDNDRDRRHDRSHRPEPERKTDNVSKDLRDAKTSGIETSLNEPASRGARQQTKAPPLNLDPDQVEEGEEPEQMETVDPDQDAMAATMGFGGFDTTKDKEVEGNQTGSVFVKKQRTWRQYMNRRGGFNRPLDKIK